MSQVRRFSITEDDIARVVKLFYARIREHEILGPVFNDAVGTGAGNWRDHEAKIESFWKNVVGLDRSFSGNPMMVHAQNHAVKAEHFPQWLALFDATVFEVLTEEKAMQFSAVAHRIGRGLSMGIDTLRGHNQGPPKLFG
ncbi:group III truncated hemoglobin [uncultured Roseobacter sp.]|uniref:group III truncated hemoglobin n=1 Tax=uncultured Roseobacter sp. TaxID=114847 RepID=UPI0026120214|nr:group III truncated hemoglobin [uncultured Roseobacter sp.]